MERRFIFSAVALGAIGVFALVVGLHDAFAAAGVSSRLFGGVLAAGGLLLLAAASGISRQASWSVALGLVATVVAFVVGVAFLVAQWGSGERGLLLLPWIAVTAAALFIAPMFLRTGAGELSRAIRRVQILAVVGTVVGLVQFWYSGYYEPAAEPPHLNWATTLEPAGSVRGLLAVRAEITLENSSETRIAVFDSMYKVVGQRVRPKRVGDPAFVKGLVAASRTAYLPATRHSREGGGSLIRVGQVVERGWWFEPGEKHTTEFLVHVPDKAYDLLRLWAQVHVAKASSLQIADKPDFGPRRMMFDFEGGETLTYVATRWPVQETSWVRQLTRTEKVVWSKWGLQPSWTGNIVAYPDIQVYVDEEDGDFDPWKPGVWDAGGEGERVLSLSTDYGLIVTYGQAELSLASPD